MGGERDTNGSAVTVGAGILGCSIAVRLVDRGVRPVLIDPDRPGQGASTPSPWPGWPRPSTAPSLRSSWSRWPPPPWPPAANLSPSLERLVPEVMQVVVRVAAGV